MKIEVGIYEKPKNKKKNYARSADGWKIICEQDKVPFRLTDKPDCPVMVFDGDTPNWFAKYLKCGGLGIVTDCSPNLLPFDVDYVADASIEYADFTGLDGSLARVQCISKIFRGEGLGKIKIHENRIDKIGITQDEFPVFIYHSYGQGGCWFTGMPLSGLLTVLGDTLRKSTSYSDYDERIVSVDKHAVTKAMRYILIKAFNMQGLPYIFLWYYPKNYQSVFAFRVDVDGVFGDNMANMSTIAKKHDFPLTFFINKSLCQNDSDEILKIDEVHEIGNHADVHNLFTDYSSNYKNIDECQKWLDELGVNNGLWFAAPRGLWNFTLHQALDDLGFLYTSDFGCCIEGYPFFPYINGTRLRTLQIPVNPFCVERASAIKVEKKEEDISSEYVSDFFVDAIEQGYKKCYPIILYSHPEKFAGMAEVVFMKINQKLTELNIWKTTITRFAEWWIHRDKYDYCAEFDTSTKKVTIIGVIDSEIQVKELLIKQ